MPLRARSQRARRKSKMDKREGKGKTTAMASTLKGQRTAGRLSQKKPSATSTEGTTASESSRALNSARD